MGGGARTRLGIAVCWLAFFAAAPAYADTYSESVKADAPSVYWRLGETQGRTAADASGHGRAGTYAAPAEEHTRTGALANDTDGAADDNAVHADAVAFKTVEAWVRADAPAQLLTQVAVSERGLVVGDAKLELSDADNRRLTDAHWHHVAVTSADGTLTAYLDGAPFASTPGSLDATGELTAARGGAFDEFAVYPQALDAATVAAHFAASGNSRPGPPVAPWAYYGGGAAAILWDPPQGAAPPGQAYIDGYIVEAWQGNVLRASRAVGGDGTGLNVTGLASGEYELRVRAFNGFGEGPPAVVGTPFLYNDANQYSELVTNDQPALYWRLGDVSGTVAADASGHDHRGVYAQRAELRDRNGPLVYDTDGSKMDTATEAYDLVRAPLASGLPTANSARTLEAWIWANGPGGRILSYGDFSATIEDRGLDVAGTHLTLPDTNDRRLTDSRWHHVAVTYADGTLTGYLDGVAFASAQATFNTATSGDVKAARFPAGKTVIFDDVAVYPQALDAPRIAAHFAASGDVLPGMPVVDVSTADNLAAMSFYIPGPGYGAPWHQELVDHYLVEAWQGDTLRAAQTTSAGDASAYLYGLPAGQYRITVRGINGFGDGPTAEREVTITGAATTYASTVEDDAPALYWRLSEYSGSITADASGHGHRARLSAPANQRYRTGALPGEANQVAVNAQVRTAAVGGLPTGDRTIEAWVSTDAPTTIAAVGVEAHALVAGGRRLASERTLTDGRWHHVAVTSANGALTAYVDGVQSDAQPGTLEPPGSELVAGDDSATLDELAIYPTALSAARIAAHFAASGNAIPAAPQGVHADVAANGLAVGWSPPPVQGLRPIEHYLVEAVQDGIVRGAQATDGNRRSATLSGLPAGAYEVRVRAVTAFSVGVPGSVNATVTGSGTTYAGEVTSDGPAVYWRLGERTGVLAHDASGHEITGRYVDDAAQHTRAGGLTGDPDPGLGYTTEEWWTPRQLLILRRGTGLPGGASPRTVEGLILTNVAGGRLFAGDNFGVGVEDRAITVGDVKLALPAGDERRFTDSHWHHVAVTYDGTTLTGYLDGEAIASAPATLDTTYQFGALAAEAPPGGTTAFDDIAVYAKALTDDQIATHFAASGNPAPADHKAPKPTIVTPASGATTSTRPKFSGRVGELPGDLQHVSLKITRNGTPVVTRELDATAGAWSLENVLVPLGELTLEITQRDQAGNIGTTSTTFTAANQAPVASLALDASDGVLPLTVRANATATDEDGDPLNFRLDFGDGTGAVTGKLPVPPVAHVYTQAGTHTVRLTVDDSTAASTATATVETRLAEAVKADAGDDRVVEAGEPLTFDARASRPTVGLESYHWTFSDGKQADGAVVSHTFADPGNATATLTVGAGAQTSSDSASITVLEPSPVVTVHVVSGGHAIAGADVLAILADGRRIAGTTNGAGDAELPGLPDGPQSVYAWAAHMRPGSAVATVSHGTGSAEITLQPGEVASAGLQSHRMSEQEIQAAGIDTHDAGNSGVYSFTAHVAVNGSDISYSGYLSDQGMIGCTCGGGGGGGGGGTYLSGGFYGGVPLLQWLVIPARVGFLKEFFNVSMVVQNLATQDFTLRGGTASLDLPAGLSLAPTSTPQAASVALPDIPGGGNAATSWVVRGDSEGSFEPRARYAAMLDPIGLPVALEARLADPLRVYGASAMKIVVDSDDRFDDRYPGHVRVGIRNTSPATISNAALQIPTEGQEHYVAQPEQRRTFAAASIAPGETWFADDAADPDDDFIVVPDLDGDVDIGKSFIAQAAGDSNDELAITQHKQVQPAAQAPRLTARRRGDWIVLKWDGVAGATGYKGFGAPNRTSEFAALGMLDAQDPSQGVSGAATKALVRGAKDTKEIALSTVTPQRLVLHHPTSEVIGAGDAHPTLTIDNADALCAARRGTLTATASDPDFAFNAIEVQFGATTIRHAVTGSPATSSFTLPSFSSGTEVTVRAYLAIGGDPVEQTLTLGRRGDSNCDGDVRIAIVGDSYISGEGAYSYLPGTDEHKPAKKLCHRSTRTWPMQLATTLVSPDKLVDPEVPGTPIPIPPGDSIAFLACSGATTENLSYVEWNGERPQFSKLIAPDWEKTDIVFLSIGGNDAGFGEVIETCLLLDCAGRDGSAMNRLLLTFLVPLGVVDFADMAWWRESKLDDLARVEFNVNQAERALRTRAPKAEVYQVNYPDPFRPLPPTCSGLSPAVALGDMFVERNSWFSNLLGSRAEALIGIPADAFGALTITQDETSWVHSAFLPQLNAAIGEAAADGLGSSHLLDVSDVMNGHPICGDDEWVHGFTRGDDRFGILGNESFHPNEKGHDALFRATSAAWGATLGSYPNPALLAPDRRARVAAPARTYGPVRTDLTGPVEGNEVLLASAPGTLELHGGPANTELRVALDPLRAVIGSGRTDADGNVKLALRLGASTAPGLHLMTVWTAAGERVTLLPAFVTGTKACAEGADADGDKLADACDGDPADGPLADADGDGVRNAEDSCPLVADATQRDSDGDSEGDACDPDQGADRFATGFRNAGAPVPAAPTAPRNVRARADGPDRAIVEWDAPAEGTISGYRVSGGGRIADAGSGERSATVSGLAPGSVVRFAVSASGGAIALSEPLQLPAAPAAPVTPQPPGGGGGPTVTPPAPKPSITFKGTAKRVKLSRKGTFVLRFKATPGLRGTYTITGAPRKLKGRFTADKRGNVTLTIRPGKPKRTLKLKLAVVSGSLRATHPLSLVRA